MPGVKQGRNFPEFGFTKLNLVTHMRTPTSNDSAPGRVRANFRSIGKPDFDLLEQSLRKNYFVRFPERYLLTDWGKIDLENHLFVRLDTDRSMVIPWLDNVRPLRGASILEVGCGTGSSTVALAEQGAEVTAIDVDASSLEVARERCRAYGLDVTLAHANVAEVYELFAGRRFDFIIFYASLEHMTLEERMSAMRATWQMLPVGGMWCVLETPNRLWYYDAHTSLLPFHMWLPDELAFEYSRFSPRYNYRELYREYTDEAKLHFLRRGRGVSFHEFELTMKPVGELKIRSSLPVGSRKSGPIGFLKWRFSDEYRYMSLLRRIAPEVHEGFLQSSLYLIIEKD
jgi:2-polyprenyl-3-methyl-5-hydroxy-6-metoxy-1,4-benzoquinol methylase